MKAKIITWLTIFIAGFMIGYFAVNSNVSKQDFTYLEKKNKALQENVNNQAAQILLLKMDNEEIKVQKKEKELSLIQREKTIQLLTNEYRKLKNQPAVEPGEVFDICDEIIVEKDYVISDLIAINADNESIIDNLSKIVDKQQVSIESVTEIADNRQEMLRVAIENNAGLKKEVRRHKVGKRIWQGAVVLLAGKIVYDQLKNDESWP